MKQWIHLALWLFIAIPAGAEAPSISPASGPMGGGTTVTIKGNYGHWNYAVKFGDVFSPQTTLVDEHTLVAVTPRHAAGVVDIVIFETDIYLTTGLTFEFIGREQFLLPVFIAPVQGAYGSEFRTELHGVNTSPTEMVEIWGLETPCRPSPPICDWLNEAMVYLPPAMGGDVFDLFAFQTGSPGRFIEVPLDQAEDLSLSLRVYDTSRAAENFGTEIPIVRTRDFRSKPFALTGVPLDPRFRNTLRLYSARPTTVEVKIGNETHHLTLPGSQHHFDPSYAQLTAFPTGTGVTDVIVTPAEHGPAVWGFISVTNNETQHITTITPQP